MPYYPPEQRRRAFSQEPRRGAVPPAFRQNFGQRGEMRRPDSLYMYNQQQQQQLQQQQQQQQQQLQQLPGPGFPQQGQRRGFPENLNTMMNHAGKLSEGINIMRQIGSFFNMFR